MNRAALREAAAIIAHGGIVAYPTESCYGLGCDARDNAAIRRLLQTKRRVRQLGLIVIGADLAAIEPFFEPLDAVRMQRVTASWPGPVTWLLPAQRGVSDWITGGHDTVALRVTAHPGAAALCRHARRALISTSANRHGRAPARSAAGVLRQFGGQLDAVLEGRLGGLAKPTEIRDARTGAVVRAA